ncbi:uncharacterized protein LOC121414890 [Lytechinus variegatus]|uniref:uncharacterized protein LOC121414890 n=1 Tax=Lytechinus variegatus TaxID=7654 RepID=UPI001BB2A888|nr:uncharacterized protein LOC121414890 [Lytechinus variegatus]
MPNPILFNRISHSSFAFCIFTANGTVYSWGVGVDGQLGHGEDVTYLAQPKALVDGVFPGRVAQVACGDSYSAALLGDGSLYMWGKSSHVIQTDQPSSQKVFRPVGIPLKGRSVAMVSCGSWHTAAITGKPERQPLEEDSDTSEEDEEEDLDTLITMETDDGIDAFQDRAGNVWEMSDEICADKTSAVSKPAQSSLRPPYRLAREGTTLTLEEFYSSTPVPVRRPRELPGVRVPERKRTAKAEVQGEDDCVDAKVTVAESERDEGESSDDSSADDDIEADETEIAAMAPPMGSTGEPEIMDKDASLKTEHDRSFTKTEKLSKKFNPQRQRDTYLSRSKTMGSIDIPKKSVSKQNQPTVYNMSAMSGSGDADRALTGKFVVDKHVAIQSRKASPLSSASSSPSSKRIESSTKQTIPTVSLVGTDSVDLPPSNDRVPKSLPMPKMTRAHTLYGPMRTHGKIRHSKSESPPVIYPVPPVVSMAYKTRPPIVRDGGHPTAKSKYGTKDKALKDLKQHHQTGNVGETASQNKTAGGRRPLGATSSSQKRPVFSSAGSWRQRSEVEDVLLRDGTPPGSPLHRKTSTKDS